MTASSRSLGGVTNASAVSRAGGGAGGAGQGGEAGGAGTLAAAKRAAAEKAAEEERTRAMIEKYVLANPGIRLELRREFNRWKGSMGGDGLKSDEEVEVLADQEEREYRSSAHAFFSFVTLHPYFGALVMLVIFVNVFTISAEAALRTSSNGRGGEVFEAAGIVFLFLYTVEFALKVYCEPVGYWRSGYNRFDFFILVASYMQYQTLFEVDVTAIRVLRALRALRALRGVSFSRSLQTIVVALVRTMASIANILVLLFLVMFVFAVMGFYLFGEVDANFRDLGTALYTLFAMVTLDGWTFFQSALDGNAGTGTRFYTIFFIFLGNFIFLSLFIGVVIENLDEAQEEEQRVQLVKRIVLAEGKKAFLSRAQQRSMKEARHGPAGAAGAADAAAERRRRRRRRLGLGTREARRSTADVMLDVGRGDQQCDVEDVEYLACNLPWVQSYVKNHELYEQSAFRTQQLHFDLAHTLKRACEMHGAAAK